MIYYHGSAVAGIRVLTPVLSEHGKPYIYFSTNPVVALLYAVKPAPKPFSYYPYGFDQDGTPVYSEYFENAFRILYQGRKGYLYECENLPIVEQPTNIPCAYTCPVRVKVDRVTEIPDLHDYFMNEIHNGKFRIKTRQEISEKEMKLVLDDMEKTVEEYSLRESPHHPMSQFTRQFFPEVF
ncbi:MAG: hypothetical protein ACI4GB_00085 [Acutalibacteraceae bacterium]